MMAEEVASQKPHILAFPWPGQGHINPMLHLCNHLASKGVKITLIITTRASTIQTAQIKSNNKLIQIECISDGSELDEKPKNAQDYIKRFRETVSRTLSELIDKINNSSNHQPAKVLVYDSVIPWAYEIAKEKGVLGASFFTQSCSVNAIYYLIHQEKCKSSLKDDSVVSSVPSLISLGKVEMPSFSYFKESSKVVEDLLTDQFLNVEKVDWIFINTFDKLEDEVVKWMASLWPVMTVGPTLLPSYLAKSSGEDDDNTRIDLFNPKTETCMEWLSTRESNTVIYVSFGSTVKLDQEQVEEIAYGLINSNCYFLWVVRESEESKLPKTFTSQSTEKGLVVNWCSQLDILSHKSVACFFTHAGWNSTLEALSLGVPMIAMPQFVDQTTNAKFVEDVWEAGVMLTARENEGIIKRDDVERCIKQVMQEEKLHELKQNALRWKKFAEAAVDEGGSSERNIQTFVSKVMSLDTTLCS